MRKILELTTEERRSLHREMWEWIAADGDRDKHDWPGWKEFDEVDVPLCCYCFACAEATALCLRTGYVLDEEREDPEWCRFCPIWSEERSCASKGAEYDQYLRVREPDIACKRQRIASIIANLPFRDPAEPKVEEQTNGNKERGESAS